MKINNLFIYSAFSITGFLLVRLIVNKLSISEKPSTGALSTEKIKELYEEVTL